MEKKEKELLRHDIERLCGIWYDQGYLKGKSGLFKSDSDEYKKIQQGLVDFENLAGEIGRRIIETLNKI